ncbi:MAG: cytochrome c [Myxococcota bacterium]
MNLLMVVLLGSLRASGADVEKGEALYQSNCMACHGVNADGKGPAAAALQPAPADFTAAAFWEGKTDEQLTAVIKNGSPNTAMIGFGRLSDEQLADIVAFLRAKAPTK